MIRKNQGFTLIELMVGSSLIIVTFLAIAVAIYHSHQQLYRNQSTAGRDAVFAMIREISSLQSTLLDSIGNQLSGQQGLVGNPGNANLCMCVYNNVAFCGGGGPACPAGGGATGNGDLQLAHRNFPEAAFDDSAAAGNARLTENNALLAASGTVADVDFNGLYSYRSQSIEGQRCRRVTNNTPAQIPFQCAFVAVSRYVVSGCNTGTAPPKFPAATCRFIEIFYTVGHNRNANNNATLGPAILRQDLADITGSIVFDLSAF